MKTAIFLAKGFEEIEAINIIDVLRRGEVTIDIISVAGNIKVEGAHGIEVNADYLFYETSYEDYDMIILPGGMPGTNNMAKHEDLCKLILDFYEQGKMIAAICAAPSILGRLGILNGHAATCYPGFEKYLEDCKIKDDDVVKSRNIITGKGPGVAMKFALEILSLYHELTYIEDLRKSLILSKYN